MTRAEKGYDGTHFRFSPRTNRANEIDWQPWGARIFERAAQECKPILLSISAVWCHWCHVMDETSYSDPAVISKVNSDYVPVRVDADERPDIDRRYNQGGWPSTVLLTPEGEVLVGATYVPPPQMSSLLTEVGTYYQANQTDIRAKIEQLQKNREGLRPRPATVPLALSEGVVSHIVQTILRDFDSQHGGFGHEPKFPQVDALQFALEQYCQQHTETLRSVVTTTLDAMERGGVFDREKGGFFRYSTTRDWSIPHFEKMLEDNAELLRLYLQAFQVTGTQSYHDTALRIIEYLEATLRDPQTGAFFGSQDADEDYYRLAREQRGQKESPLVDATIFTDRNAGVASAYLTAFATLGDARYRDVGIDLVDFLWSHLRSPDAGMYHFFRGEPRLTGLLNDQIRTAEALLDAYEATGTTRFLERAVKAMDLVQRDFYDRQGGGFFDISEKHAAESEAGLQHREKLITDNAVAAIQLLRLHHLTRDPKYMDLARSALEPFSDTYPAFKLFGTPYGRAVDRLLREPTAVNIVAGTRGAKADDLLYSSLHAFAPWKVVRVFDPAEDMEQLREAGFNAAPETRAYVCVNQTCSPPLTEADEVEKAVRSC